MPKRDARSFSPRAVSADHDSQRMSCPTAIGLKQTYLAKACSSALATGSIIHHWRSHYDVYHCHVSLRLCPIEYVVEVKGVL